MRGGRGQIGQCTVEVEGIEKKKERGEEGNREQGSHLKVNLFSSVNVLKLLEGNNTQGIYDLHCKKSNRKQII